MSANDERYLNGTRLSEVWAKVKAHVTTQLASYETKANVAIIDQTLTSAIGNLKASLGSAAYQDISIFASAEEMGEAQNDITSIKASVSTLQGYFTNGVAKSAAKLTTGAQTLFGNTYWTSGGVPTSIGTSSAPAGLNYVTDINSNLLYFDRTNSRVGIGTTSPGSKFSVNGNTTVTGNIAATGSITAIGNVLALGDVSADGGVSALGIAELAIGAGAGGSSVVSQIQIDGTTQTNTDGTVNLPAYPVWSTLSGKPTALSAFTNDTGYITDLDIVTTMSQTPSIAAQVGKMYTFGRYINSLTVTLPTMTDTTKTKVIMFMPPWNSGKNTISITSTHTIRYTDDYQIDAGGFYLMKALFVGNVWLVSAQKIKAI